MTYLIYKGMMQHHLQMISKASEVVVLETVGNIDRGIVVMNLREVTTSSEWPLEKVLIVGNIETPECSKGEEHAPIDALHHLLCLRVMDLLVLLFFAYTCEEAPSNLLSDRHTYPTDCTTS